MKRLTIAFVADRFGKRYGGAEAYGVELMRELARDHDITVFAREYDAESGLALKHIALPAWAGWPSWARVMFTALRVRRLTHRRFDIVHSHTNGWSGDIEVIHVTPVRYNWRVRALPWLKRLTSYISPRVLSYLWLEARRVDSARGAQLVAVSSLIADQLRQAYGLTNIPVIAPGVTLPSAESGNERLEVRRKLKVCDEHIVCLMVARNPLRKGLMTAIAALHELPDYYRLWVVGSDAATRASLEKLPTYKALTERVTLVPATSDVAPYYWAADLCVHPTLNDSFGMVALEAMAYGLPVVVSAMPWCGFAAYLQDGQDAVLLQDPRDERHLAQSIVRIMQDDALRMRLKEGGRCVALRHSWATVARRYVDLYRQVMAQRRQ